MNKNFIEFIVFDYMLPIISMLASGDSDTGYAFLPGENSDPEDIAWVYYYAQFKGIEKSVRKCSFISSQTRKSLLSLLKEVKTYMTSFSGVDALPASWFFVNEELKSFTCAYNLLSDHKFKEQGKKENYAVIDAFISHCCFIYPIANNWDEISGTLSSQSLLIQLSQTQKDDLRQFAQNLKSDNKAMESEMLLRLAMIESLTGDIKACRPSKRAKSLREEIEADGTMKVYHFIEDKDKIKLLIVTNKRLYWNNERPGKGVLGVFAFGYEEDISSPENGEYRQVMIKR